MIANCTGLVLAGGNSRRMGHDKAEIEFAGQTLLARSVEQLRQVFPQVLVSVREMRPEIATPQVLDERTDAGPLAGLCAGLAAAETPWVFAMAVDMPFLATPLIQRLAAHRTGFDAVVPLIDGHPQTLAAFYATAALPQMRALLDAPERAGLRSALEQLNVRWVNEEELAAGDEKLHGFFDVDTPEDLVLARRIVGE